MSLSTRIQNIWRPWNFHFHHKLHAGQPFFEGWYFKVVDAAGAQPYAFIPGVFMGKDAHAFIQVLDGRTGTAWYHRYPIDTFEAARDRFDVRFAGNRFHAGGVELDIDLPEQRLKGSIALGPWSKWPVTFTSPGVMGPYSFVPFMECKHGILSLDHTLSGSLDVDGNVTQYDGGRGYMEKDWGRGFPLGYVWTQSNHFDRPGICVTASVARIPWITGNFRGFLVGFLLDGELHRFTTYTGAAIESLRLTKQHMHLTIRNRTHRLNIEAEKTHGALLRAPYEHDMLERVAETMTSTIALRFSEIAGDRTVYEGEGRSACLETQGRLDLICDDIES
jgi:hypothetical protein